YRMCRQGRDDLDYIGQTGEGTMTLSNRLGMLRGIDGTPRSAYRRASPLPLRGNSTAFPSWSRSRPSLTSTPWRKGLECVAISLYRQQHQRFPTVNVGRMPLGYRMSSGNTAKLMSKEKHFRGGPTSERDNNHLPSRAPVGPL